MKTNVVIGIVSFVLSILIFFLFQPVENYFAAILYRKNLDLLDRCVKLEWRSVSQAKCYKNVFPILLNERGISGTLKAVQLLDAESEIFTAVDCHLVSHLAGRAAYQKYGRDAFSDAFQENIFCTGGYEHGVLEAYFDDHTNLSTDFLIAEVCGSFWHSYPDNKGTTCFHALGHSLMFLYKNETDAPLEACEKLPNPWQQNMCGFGVFMEYAYAYGKGYDRVNKNLDNMTDLCRDMKNKWRKNCIFFIGIAAFAKDGSHDIALSFKECNSLSEADRKICHNGMALVIGLTSRSVQSMEADCKYAVPRKSSCLMHAARYFFQYQNTADSRSQSFCDRFVDSSEKNECKKLMELDVWIASDHQ